MTTVEVCPRCDIAGCFHIREGQAMSDQDPIRRGDALEAISKAVRRDPMPTIGRILDAIAALPADTSLVDLQAEREIDQRYIQQLRDELAVTSDRALRLMEAWRAIRWHPRITVSIGSDDARHTWDVFLEALAELETK